MCREPVNRICDLFRRRFLDVDAITPIVVFRWAEVPAVHSIRCPCFTDACLLVY